MFSRKLDVLSVMMFTSVAHGEIAVRPSQHPYATIAEI